MEIVGTALAGLYVIVAIASVSFASPEPASSVPAKNTIAIDCSENKPTSASVSKPTTTVSVTCADSTTVQPETSTNPKENVYFGAECAQPGVLSSICPGATVVAAEPSPPRTNGKTGPTVNVLFPQLPTSAQVVCLKCHKGDRGDETQDCKAVINVAAAAPEGPQACAVAGSSVTLQINKAGGSAQFACGEGFDLAPKEATKAYADDCTREETLKDMTQSPGPQNYVTLRVDKLRKKKMCYLCKQRAADAKKGGEQNACTIYVEVSAATRLSSNVALACVAAVLQFI